MVFGDTKELMSKDKSLRFSCTIHLNKAESGLSGNLVGVSINLSKSEEKEFLIHDASQ